jgi:outer membrane protein TolC
VFVNSLAKILCPRPARLAATLGTLTFASACGASSNATGREAAAATTARSPNSRPTGNARTATAPADDRATSPEQVVAAERALPEEATLDRIVRVALARNPDLTEAGERVRAAREAAPAASRLPDPEFEYQLWGQPIARPVALDETQMHMFGLRQSFPAPGSLGARSEAATAQAKVASETRRAREQDLIARVRRAYAEYYRADREYRIHLEHGRLSQQVLDLARAAYAGGRGTQQDVLRAVVELSRRHNDLATIDRDRRAARGLLNTLMARPAEAPLGPPAPIEPAKLQVRFDELTRSMAERRPEIAAAQSAIRARESELEAARATGRWPSFMVGVQYMYMPPMDDPHNYGVSFSMSLPWLNPRYGEEVRAAEARVSAERSALSSVRFAVRYELYEAIERLKAARESFTIIERDLLPQAVRSFESAQAVYRGGQADSLALFDALRSLLDVRIERERALTRIETALADMERAAGGPISAQKTGVLK